MEVLRCAINFMRLRKKTASKHIDLKAFEQTHLLLQRCYGKPKSDFQGGCGTAVLLREAGLG